jgi:hypothetical protein
MIRVATNRFLMQAFLILTSSQSHTASANYALLDLIINIFHDSLQGCRKRLASARALQQTHSFR